MIKTLNLNLFFVILFSVFSSVGYAQQKKTLSWDDVRAWNRITESSVSDNGEYIAVKSEPWKGDACLKLYDRNRSEEIASFRAATGHKFMGDVLLFTEKPLQSLVDSLTLKKTKKESMPKDRLVIYNIKTKKSVVVDSLKGYKTPERWGGFIAYQTVTSKDKDAPSALNIYSLSEDKTTVIESVTDYKFAEEGQFLAYTVKSDSIKNVDGGVYIIDLSKNSTVAIHCDTTDINKLTISRDGHSVAFITSLKDDQQGVANTLYYWNGKDVAKKVVGRDNSAMPSGWIVSENGTISFSESGERIFFGVAPKYQVKDTTIIESDRPKLDIWHWDEPKLATQQIVDKEKDMKRSFQAMYSVPQNGMSVLGTKDMPRVEVLGKGDSDLMLIQTSVPYEKESMWEGEPRSDIYIKNIENGTLKEVVCGVRCRVRVSPESKYLYWYLPSDSTWNSYNIAEQKHYKLTSPSILKAYDEINDTPSEAQSNGEAGWLKNDEALLVYDRYDIWKLDPESRNAPVNYTKTGRNNKISYRVVNFDKDVKFIDGDEKTFLTVFNENTKGSGYAVTTLNKVVEPKMLHMGNFRLSTPLKSKSSDVIIFTKETFEMAPDVYVSSVNDLKKIDKLTDIASQQSQFNWGTAELISWVNADGITVEGVVYKPENFDPNKKYPMICNFYERNSDELYSYHTPEAHRSTLDYHFYTSNGYIVFNPDIVYKDGYPGESCLNTLMPAISLLISKGYVDPKRIGAQGHSWGGYQVAYLATRTNIFAAIESGAPVVNMLSAYGGIRWETGLNRAFQYEHTQSRIGKTIWEAPLLYIENSPLFNMDKVTTPILIMHNDKDGHVPWWQGIEYFIALRRLGKPAWLLNYNDEPHWPMKLANKLDFQIRMEQFFNHYLKDAPMPEWMATGRGATDKDFSLGY